MRDYVDVLDRYKGYVLFVISFVVVVCSFWLKDLAFEGSYRIWFAPESKLMQDYDEFVSNFSSDDTFIVAFRDEKGIFNPKAINLILQMTEDISSLDGVRRVDSLSNYQYISAVDDDLSVEDFIYADEVGDLNAKEKKALQDRLILNHIISKDGKTTILSVRLRDSVSKGDEKLNLEVMQELQQIASRYKQKYGYEIYITGTPAVTASLVEIAKRDALYLMPLCVVIVVLFLWLLFGDVVGVIVPSLVILYTFVIVLSMQFMLGYKLNNFTVNIPAFISAIAIADSLHLLIAWRHYKQTHSRKESVYKALKSNLKAIWLTSFTTAVGFVSLGFSDIVPVRTLGYAISFGALLAFVLSILLAPALLLYVKESYKPSEIKLLDFSSLRGYGAFVSKYDKHIVVSLVFLIAILLYGIKYVNVDNNSIKYFDKSTTVRAGSDFVERYISGAMTYEIVIDSKHKDGVKQPHFLELIDKFEKELQQKYPNVVFAISIKDIIQRMHSVLDTKSKTPLPQDANLTAQYILLYSMSIPQGMSINDQVDIHNRYLRMTINSKTQTTSQDIQMIRWIKQWWQIHTPYSATVQGVTAIFSYMQESVIKTLLVSIFWTFVIISVAMLLIFKRLKALLVFILPNLLPLLLIAGIMGYMHINIDIGVVISASIILGIAVDDTIHFFSKYFQAREHMGFEESIDYVLVHSGNAMVLTTLILSLTFLVFAISSFIPNNHFSFVTVVALNLALVFDLLLLPALMSVFFRKL